MMAFHRIDFEIMMLTFKALHGMAPLYRQNILETYKPARLLRSNNKRLLIVPKYHLKTYGLRAFSVIAPRLWSDLPDETCQARASILLRALGVHIRPANSRV